MLALIYQPRPLVTQSANIRVPNVDVSRLEPECPLHVDSSRWPESDPKRRGSSAGMRK
jgi:hypothetical protein